MIKDLVTRTELPARDNNSWSLIRGWQNAFELLDIVSSTSNSKLKQVYTFCLRKQFFYTGLCFRSNYVEFCNQCNYFKKCNVLFSKWQLSLKLNIIFLPFFLLICCLMLKLLQGVNLLTVFDKNVTFGLLWVRQDSLVTDMDRLTLFLVPKLGPKLLFQI